MYYRFLAFVLSAMLLLTGCTIGNKEPADIQVNTDWELNLADSNALTVLLATAKDANEKYPNLHFVLRLSSNEQYYDYELDQLQAISVYNNHELSFTAVETEQKLKTNNGVMYINDLDDTLIRFDIPFTLALVDQNGSFNSVIISTTQPLVLTPALKQEP